MEFESSNKFFKSSRLSLNFHKIYFIQFATKNSPQIDLYINYANRLICKACDTKFLGIDVDSTLSGKIMVNKLHTHTHTHTYTHIWRFAIQ
jgi:hypothetical protein